MKINILRSFVIAGIAVMTLGSCSDFLDTEQPGVTPTDEFYKTDDEAYQAAMACYYSLKFNGDQQIPVDYFQMNVLSDDAQAGGGSRSDNNQGNELNEFTFSSSNTILSAVYENMYNTIYKCNLLLKNVAEVSEVKKLCRAEAKTIRAFCYFTLVTYWGNPPLVLEPLEAGNYNQPNSTSEEVYAQIEKDLTEAIAVLPARSQQSTANRARCSKGFAQSLLGKTYLFEKKYKEAAQILDEVINSGEYALYPDFAKLFTKAGEFCEESIFELNYVANATEQLQGNAIAAYCGPRSPWFNAGTTGLTESGWGWVNPEKALHDAYVKAGDKVRGYATVLSEDELINVFHGSIRNATDNSIPYGCDGLVRVKYTALKSEFVNEDEGYHVLGEMNFRVMRYADVLLMAAEAHNRLGDNDDLARKYVNLVRERAKLADLDGTYTGDKLFEAIKTERQLELAFENVRFRDLVRWGDAKTVLKDSGKKTSLGTYENGVEQFFENSQAGYKDYNNVLPYPEREISVNPNIKQNPQY